MDTLWFYYWGGAAMHGNRHLTFGRGMGLAQLRADGFCSVRAERFPGMLITKAIEWPGGSLILNAVTLGGAGNGSIRVEVLTEDLAPVPGLTGSDSDPLKGDSCKMEATWQGRSDAIAVMQGRTIRLKIHIDNSDLFSFRAVAVGT